MTWNYKVDEMEDNESIGNSYLAEVFPEISPKMAAIRESIKAFRAKVKLSDPEENLLDDGIVLHWRGAEIMAVCLQPEQMVWVSVRTGRTVPEWKGIRLIRKWYHQRIREEK